jgi:hypothetical protein
MLLYSDYYQRLAKLRSGMVDMGRILKSTQGSLYNLAKWQKQWDSVKNGDANASIEEVDRLQLLFLKSVKQVLFGSRYIFWPVFDTRQVLAMLVRLATAC